LNQFWALHHQHRLFLDRQRTLKVHARQGLKNTGKVAHMGLSQLQTALGKATSGFNQLFMMVLHSQMEVSC
jgi:hypothetical protein